MKTDEQFLKDRQQLFESEGWLDLKEELKNIEDSVKDISTIEDEKALWHAKGQLQILGLLLSLEEATKLASGQLETARSILTS